jgi:Domain of unknown function (DUF4331)
MNRLKIFFGLFTLTLSGLFLISADHIDAPAVTNGTADITDFYAFQSSENSANMVFAVNLQGLLAPGATAAAAFDENVLIEINIDNDGDNVEELVIQLIPRDGKMYAFGPYAPNAPGLNSTIDDAATRMEVDITAYGETAKIGTSGASKLFAGPRDDPFFFDLGAYQAILGGTATGFSNPGTDTFAGSNVLSVVVEVPKSTLGNATSVNAWVETKTKN